MAASHYIGALDMGTAKVSILVAELSPPSKLKIIGRAMVPSRGIRKGRVLNVREATTCVHRAIREAEKSAGVNLKSLYMSISGSHLKGELQVGKAQVSHSARIVTDYDVGRAVEEAKRRDLGPDRVFVQYIRNPFLLDGKKVDEPYSLRGNEIQASFWAVHADARVLREQMQIVNSFVSRIDDIFLSSLVVGRVLTSEEQRQSGVLVLDIGAGTTDFVLYGDGYVLMTGVLDVGGDHITNDLSVAFKIPWESAERLKVDYGKATPVEGPADDWVWLRGDLSIGDRRFSKRAIQRVIHARMEELFQLVRRAILPVLEREDLRCSALMTGGVTRLTAIENLAGQVLKMPAASGRNPDWVINELQVPEMSNVLGQVQFALQDYSDSVSGSRKTAGLFGKVKGFWSK